MERALPSHLVSDQLHYHMRMKSRVVTATEFKAKCLALLDEIGRNGGMIAVTKRGLPMASVGPVRNRLWPSSEGLWRGKHIFRTTN
jgi:hypothetical protein